MSTYQDTSAVPEIIAAVGAVVSTLLGIVLVHLRLMANRETKQHRDDECKIQEAIIKKLGIEIDDLKKERDAKS